MGCGCSSKSKSSEEKKDAKVLSNQSYAVKLIVFSVLVLISPVFLGVIIWVLFRTLVLDKEMDILPLVLKLAGKEPKNEDDEDDDDEDYDEDDVIAVNVEDITNKYK